MASKNVKVSQNFCEISRVSQSRFLSVSESLKSLEFFAKPFWSLILGLAIQRPQKVSVSKRKTLVLPSRKGSYLPFATPSSHLKGLLA